MASRRGSGANAGENGQHNGRMARAAVALESKGYRLTPHRAAVHTYLASVAYHPTAEEVYLAVKPQVSQLSLATVYNALEALVEAGLASKFTFGDGSARYDIRTDQHDHIYCLGCGLMQDLPPTIKAQTLEKVPVGDFEVTGYRLQLVGYCADCRGRVLK